MTFLLATATTSEAHESLPLSAPELFRLGGFVVTNSMLYSWVIALLIIAFAQYATRKIKAVPDGAQNFWEWIIESLADLLEGILGRDLLPKTFPFFATIFIFILASNWLGLIPGVGSIGWGDGASFFATHVEHPLIRGANADLNMTAAMAMIFFALWLVWSLQANGPVGLFKHIFLPDVGMTGIAALIIGVIFFVVGIIELMSIAIRPLALMFRLYGNVYGGESMLDYALSAVKIPFLAWVLPLPFYVMEVLVGLVQALVFCLLTAVFTAMTCRHEEHQEHHGEGKASH